MAINDAPELSGPSEQTIDEDTILTFSPETGNAIQVHDVDAGDNALQVTLTVGQGAVLTLGGLDQVSLTTGDGVADMTMTFEGHTSLLIGENALL